MSTARELLVNRNPNLKDSIGKVEIPCSFNDTSLFNDLKIGDYLLNNIAYFNEKQEVISEYTNIKEKIGGYLIGFYVNHIVRQQNALNSNYATVMNEFVALCEKRYELNKKMNELRAKVQELEEAQNKEAKV